MFYVRLTELQSVLSVCLLLCMWRFDTKSQYEEVAGAQVIWKRQSGIFIPSASRAAFLRINSLSGHLTLNGQP